jgi:hypothetical protein
VLDAVMQTEKGERPGAEHIFVDPLLNPHADPRKLAALRSSMTLHDWETQVRGRMLQLPDRVLYTWDRAVNERPAPDFGRITREFLTAWEGDRGALGQVDRGRRAAVPVGRGRDLRRVPRPAHASRSEDRAALDGRRGRAVRRRRG